MNEFVEDFYKECVVISLESTSTKPDFAEIIELGYGCYHDNRWLINSELYKPWELIPPEISARNLISNRMVADKEYFEESCKPFFDLLNSYESPLYLVSHNAKYVETVFETYSLKNRVNRQVIWICTHDLARRVFGKTEEGMSYTLEYLRYRLDLDVGDDVTAHRAGADVEVITKLLERIVADAIKYKIIDGDKDIGVQLVKITLEPEIIKTFPFGKHRDVPLKDIPTDYFNWALQNMDVFKEESEKYNPDLLYSIGLILEQRGVI